MFFCFSSIKSSRRVNFLRDPEFEGDEEAYAIILRAIELVRDEVAPANVCYKYMIPVTLCFIAKFSMLQTLETRGGNRKHLFRCLP